MQITIAEVKRLTTKKGAQYLSVNDTGGEHYSCFDAELFSVVKEGSVLEADIETKGEYKNIIGAELVATGAAKGKSEYANIQEEKQVSIESQAVAKIDSQESIEANKLAAGLWQTGQLKDIDPEVLGLRQWILSKQVFSLATPKRPEDSVIIPNKFTDKLSLGAIRSALAAKGYMTATEQKDAMVIREWDELADFEAALIYIDSLETKSLV